MDNELIKAVRGKQGMNRLEVLSAAISGYDWDWFINDLQTRSGHVSDPSILQEDIEKVIELAQNIKTLLPCLSYFSKRGREMSEKHGLN